MKYLQCWYSSEDGNEIAARKSAILVDIEELKMCQGV